MRKTLLKAIIIALIMLFSCPVSALASLDQVQVRLPSYDIRLNGVLVNQINSRYPLINYKDITYSPLTWSGCRFMGLETSWSNDLGLIINNSDHSSDYSGDDSCINDLSSKYSATLCPYPITINAKPINNSTEPYPFLVFRGVTYLPLTWKYAAGDLGWSYSWTDQGGLQIESPLAKENSSENLFTIINHTAFSRGYRFSCQTNIGNEALSIEGTVENCFTEEGQGGLKFKSTVTPTKLVPFERGISIKWWAWVFDNNKSAQPLGPTIQGEGGNWSNTQGIANFPDSPISWLTLFQITQDERKAVQSVQLLSPREGEPSGLERYRITFMPGSKWANRTIEALVDNNQGVLREINDTYQASPASADYYLPSYNYSLRLKIDNVFKQ